MTTTKDGPLYPQVHVELVGRDGNAMFIIGRVTRALRKAGVDQEEINGFIAEATAGSYDDLLQVVMRWVDAS